MGLIVFLCYSFSCSIQKSSIISMNSIHSLEHSAIKTIIERYYDKKRNYSSDIIIHNQLEFSYFKWILKELDCKQCKEPLIDSMIIVEFPNIKTPYTIKIGDIKNKAAKMEQSGNYITFSPLMETNEKNIYCIISETLSYDSTDISIHQIKKKKNGQFEYIKNIDNFVTF